MEQATRKVIHPSVYPWLGVLALCAAGMAVSLYLAHLHWAVHNDFNYTSFCAYSRAVNCETVAESPFSVFLGVPVAVWGMLGYLAMAGLALWGLAPRCQGRRMWMLLYVLAGFSCLVSVVLLVISKLFIRSVCILCMASYAINFSLMALAMHFRSKRKVPLRSGLREDLALLWKKRRVSLPAALLLSALVMLLPLTYPPYWKAAKIIPSSRFHTGFTKEGFPWIGALNPVLTIHEFSDYRCFYCRKAQRFLRSLLSRFPDKLRVVHRNFPLDSACNPAVEGRYHPGACDLAAWAICAGKQGAFWEMHDALFHMYQGSKGVDLKELASRLGLDYQAMLECLKSQDMRKRLAKDIQPGIVLGMDATPWYLIEGKPYKGKIPRKILEEKLGKLE